MVAPNETINFTKAALDKLPSAPEGKRFTFKDARVKGLIIRVTPTGQKTFQLYQKHQGRPVRVTLGTFPDTTIEQARKAATKAKGKLAEGINPNVEKNKLKQEITFKELFTLYMERYSKIEKKSWKYDEREINKFLKHWFNRKISTITKYEIKTLHLKIREENGLYQANRILERIRAMYNKAIEWGWQGQNPTQGIKKFKEVSRDRFVLPFEMPLLLQAIDAEANEVAKAYLLLSLFTGARKSNVLQMRWDQIDWHSKSWRIPDTKNGEPQIVALSEKALEILERLNKHSNRSPWVLHSATSNSGHLTDPKKAWTRVKQRATIAIWRTQEDLRPMLEEIERSLPVGHDVGSLYQRAILAANERGMELPKGIMDVRLHDIRRTFGSYQAMSGSSELVIGKSLGHRSPQSTRVYARLLNDPIRSSINAATNAMLGVTTESDND